MDFDPTAPRIVPDPLEREPDDRESLDVWGFRDTRFRARADGVVVLTGGRYELSGQELPDLLAWVQRTIHPECHARRPEPVALPAARSPRRAATAAFLDEIAEDPRRGSDLRRRRSCGCATGTATPRRRCTRSSTARSPRVPDLVVFPADEAQVEALVQAALRHDVVLDPVRRRHQRDRRAALPGATRRARSCRSTWAA